ncbi:MAG: VanZ family protein [Clostridia bacterium]|nr:VanZ family protein [Clostridia bacterium]
MKNKIIIIVLSWLMVLATMLIIYSFSGETATESSETSGGFIKLILELFLPDEKITDELVSKFQHPVRKIAHFTIFALLGFCFANAFNHTFNIKSLYKNLFSFVSSVLYASFDEFHQSFVANRGPSFKDVIIDSVGALTGVLLHLLMIYLIALIKQKKQKRHQ